MRILGFEIRRCKKGAGKETENRLRHFNGNTDSGFSPVELEYLNKIYQSDVFQKLLDKVSMNQPQLGTIGMEKEQKAEAFTLLNGFSMCFGVLCKLMQMAPPADVDLDKGAYGSFGDPYLNDLYPEVKNKTEE